MARVKPFAPFLLLSALACAALPLAPVAAETAVPPARGAGSAESEVVHTLLAELKKAPDEEAAELIEQAILRLWLRSGSDTVDLLMSRAMTAMKDENFSLALELLNAVVELRPDYAEGWNKRATLFYRFSDLSRSLADVERTLALEPRHFGALAGLGLILRDLGDKRGALDAFRRALAVHPYLEAARRAVSELSADVEGRDI